MILAGFPVYVWLGVLALVLTVIAVDLGVFHRKAHTVGMKEALGWTVAWAVLAIAFNVALYYLWDRFYVPDAGEPAVTRGDASMSFLAGYIIELALSVDNIFVFLVVFRYFKVPEPVQHRVLFYGILGALLFRAIFIGLGATILEHFEWSMVIFGGFLVFTGIKMGTHHGEIIHMEDNKALKLIKRFVPVSHEFHGSHFFVKEGGRTLATPLLVTLVFIEFTDIIFAVDSIPAIFAVTHEAFIVFTSNVFAILGLRSLFFALAGATRLFHYLSYGLSVVLVFVGGKMLYGYAQHAYFEDWPKFPIAASLGIIGGILIASVIASLLWPPDEDAEGTAHGA